MKSVIKKLNQLKGVKTAKRKGENLIRIEPHSKDLKGQEEKKIIGDLRKITPRISSVLDDSRKVKNWEWNTRPEKKYSKTKLGNSITDRKAKGHKPAHYLVTVYTE